MTDSVALRPLADIAPDAVETLLDRAFGTDRRGRTAYRVRAGVRPIEAFSFAAVDARGGLLGSIQTWPVRLVGDDGHSAPLVMVGPVAVQPALQRGGLGRRLMQRLLDAADAADLPGADALMLIGDPEYYARFFGFSADRTARWRLPGPFEPHRLLARGAAVPDRAGTIGARAPADA